MSTVFLFLSSIRSFFVSRFAEKGPSNFRVYVYVWFVRPSVRPFVRSRMYTRILGPTWMGGSSSPSPAYRVLYHDRVLRVYRRQLLAGTRDTRLILLNAGPGPGHLGRTNRTRRQRRLYSDNRIYPILDSCFEIRIYGYTDTDPESMRSELIRVHSRSQVNQLVGWC